jgi:hypothetical protein
LFRKDLFELKNGSVLDQERMIERLSWSYSFLDVFLEHLRKQVNSVCGYGLVFFGLKIDLALFVFVEDSVSTKLK